MKNIKKRIGISSPTTSLPRNEFIELRACIEEANQILQTLGNPRTPENPRQLQLKLGSLIGKQVKAEISFQGKFKTITGILREVGKNYIQLGTKNVKRYVMFDHLISVAMDAQDDHYPQHQKNPYFNEKLNCEILYNFTDVVSGSVKLLNRFYGIPLSVALLQDVGKKIRIKQADSATIHTGILVNTTDQAVIIRIAGQEQGEKLETIPFDKIEVIRIQN
ncbi:hypothetical protein [Paenibacillus sp. Marseille-Q7038]